MSDGSDLQDTTDNVSALMPVHYIVFGLIGLINAFFIAVGLFVESHSHVPIQIIVPIFLLPVNLLSLLVMGVVALLLKNPMHERAFVYLLVVCLPGLLSAGYISVYMSSASGGSGFLLEAVLTLVAYVVCFSGFLRISKVKDRLIQRALALALTVSLVVVTIKQALVLFGLIGYSLDFSAGILVSFLIIKKKLSMGYLMAALGSIVINILAILSSSFLTLMFIRFV